MRTISFVIPTTVLWLRITFRMRYFGSAADKFHEVRMATDHRHRGALPAIVTQLGLGLGLALG